MGIKRRAAPTDTGPLPCFIFPLSFPCVLPPITSLPPPNAHAMRDRQNTGRLACLLFLLSFPCVLPPTASLTLPECTRNREYNYSYAQTQLNAGMGHAVGAGALLAVPWGGGPHAIDDRRTDLPRHAAGFGERWGRERDRQTRHSEREKDEIERRGLERCACGKSESDNDESG